MVLYLVVFLSVCNLGSLRTSKVLVSLHAIELGANPVTIGVLVATYAVLPLLLAVHAGRYSDRVGPRRPIILGSLCMALGLALPTLWPALAALFLVAAMLGLGNLFFNVAAHSVIGALGTGGARNSNFATFGLGASISGMVAPLVAGFSLDHFGYTAAYLEGAAIAVLPALILLARPYLFASAEQPRERQQGVSMRELLQDSTMRNTLFTCCVVISGVDLFSFYMPLYGASLKLQASVIGIIMALYAGAAFVVRFWMPHLSRRFSDQQILAWSLAISGATYFLFPFFKTPFALGAIAFLLGLGLGCGQPLSLALTYSHAPSGRAGEALGLRLAVNRFTQIAIPVVFGSLGTAFGVYPIFWSNALFLLAGGYLTARSEKPAPSRTR
jgi:MFS family permease